MCTQRILYGAHFSPPTRAARMALEALELDYEFKLIDIDAGEQNSLEYLKKNPQHTIPTLEEIDGHCLSDSHAIMAYLVRRYGKDNDALYPKSYYERARVDQRLHYENGVLFMSLCRSTLNPLIRGELKKAELPAMLKSVDDTYAMLETMLHDYAYMAGDKLTIADFSIVSVVNSIANFVQIDAAKYAKLNKWFETMKQLPYYEKVNAVGVRQLREKMETRMAQLN